MTRTQKNQSNMTNMDRDMCTVMGELRIRQGKHENMKQNKPHDTEKPLPESTLVFRQGNV